MRDIEIAKNYLENENLAIAVVKDGKLIFKSKDRGIKPMYILATDIIGLSKEASIADRVIGKGAAMLCKYMEIKEVYGQLISNNAIEVFNIGKIDYSYGATCPYIKNRDKTDLCPIEKIAMDIDDIDILLEEIGKFLNKIKA